MISRAIGLFHRCFRDRAAVTALSEALALGQEQVYRPLEEEVIPALKKSTAFGNFVDDLSSLEVKTAARDLEGQEVAVLIT